MSPKKRKDRIGEHRQIDVDHASDDASKKATHPPPTTTVLLGRFFRSRMAGTPLS